jgi:hypothetical protein
LGQPRLIIEYVPLECCEITFCEKPVAKGSYVALRREGDQRITLEFDGGSAGLSTTISSYQPGEVRVSGYWEGAISDPLSLWERVRVRALRGPKTLLPKARANGSFPWHPTALTPALSPRERGA